MEDPGQSSLLIFIALLALAAFFAIAETALSSVSKPRVKAAADKGDPRAIRALKVLEQFDSAITTLLICTNIVHISAATIVTVAVTRIWGLGAVSLATVIMTIVIFFAGEMLPKSIAKKNAFKLTLASAGVVSFLMTVFKPASSALAFIGSKVAEAAGTETEATVTEDEIVDLIEDLEEGGAIDEEQSDLMQATIDFGDTWVKHIMTPVNSLVSVNVDASAEKNHERILKSNHSRIPVYKDTRNNIIGVLQIRKYFKEYLAKKDYPDIKELMDPVYIVNRNTPIDEVLEKMSHRRINMAVIQGTDMQARGVVTIEDILEELVGEIYDESDRIPKTEGGTKK